jgi:hypothetical protein
LVVVRQLRVIEAATLNSAAVAVSVGRDGEQLAVLSEEFDVLAA